MSDQSSSFWKKQSSEGLAFWGKSRLQTCKKGGRSIKCNFRLRVYGDHYPGCQVILTCCFLAVSWCCPLLSSDHFWPGWPRHLQWGESWWVPQGSSSWLRGPCRPDCSIRPTGVRWSPLRQGPHSPPNPTLSVMLSGPVSGLLGEMAR